MVRCDRDNQAVKQAIPALTRHLDDPDKGIRNLAAQTLNDINDSRSFPALLKFLAAEAAAANSFQNCNIAVNLAGQGHDQARNYLFAALHSPNGWERGDAAFSIHDCLHLKLPMETWLACLSDQYKEVRRSALSALGDLGDPRAIPYIQKLLLTPRTGTAIDLDDGDRNAATAALRQLGATAPTTAPTNLPAPTTRASR